jgi:hypothetical protein
MYIYGLFHIRNIKHSLVGLNKCDLLLFARQMNRAACRTVRVTELIILRDWKTSVLTCELPT